jgi:hypothetical protein
MNGWGGMTGLQTNRSRRVGQTNRNGMRYPKKYFNSLGLIALVVFTAVLLSSVLPRDGHRPDPAGHVSIQTGTGLNGLANLHSARPK